MSLFFAYMALVAYSKTEEYIKQLKQAHFGIEEKETKGENTFNESDESKRFLPNGNEEEEKNAHSTQAGRRANAHEVQSEDLVSLSPAAGADFTEFQRRRRLELMADDTIHGLSQADMTAIIVLEWQRQKRGSN